MIIPSSGCPTAVAWRLPVYFLLRMAFKAGAEDAGSGELLAEAEALQSAFCDLDGKTRRANALDELVMAARRDD